MKTRILFFISLFLCLTMQAQENTPWFVDPPFTMPQQNPKQKLMPLVKVQGNHFVTPDGSTILFRGIAISDPDKVERSGHWNKKHFEKVKDLGGNVVRIPIHPIAWRERTPEKYLQLLDQAVEWCTDLNMYVMLDWHTIGNLEMEMFQDPMYVTTKQETFDFWRKIAARFAGNNTVAFYELFNEPTTYRGQLGVCTWSEWRKLVENMITVIRFSDKETIPLVAGFDWAYDLTPLRIEPINAEGIAYTTHPYSNKSPQPWTATWEENFGFAANTYPVFATEFSHDAMGMPELIDPAKGFAPGNFKLIDPTKGFTFDNIKMQAAEPIDPNGDHYGTQIIGYLEKKGISWTVWVFDPTWGGSKIKSWNYELTPGAVFFSEAMKGNLKVQKELAGETVVEDKSAPQSTAFSDDWQFRAGKGDKSWSENIPNEKDWVAVTTKKTLAESNLATEEGFGWYKKNVTLTDDYYNLVQKKGGVMLRLDSIAGMDTVYINGVQAGAFSMNTMSRGGFLSRSYFVPASLLKKGANTVAVKFFANWGDNAPFGKGLLRGASLQFVTAQTANLVALNYTVKDDDYIFFAPSAISITAKVKNDNAWPVNGKFIISVTTDDFRPVKTDSKNVSVKGKSEYAWDFDFTNPDPGFYRYTVQFVRDNDINLEQKFNLGFEPEKISSPLDAHDDFKSFWDNSLKELAKVAPEYKLTLVSEASNADYEVYLVEMKSLNGVTIRGYYSKPLRKGKFPVLVEYMGYGSTPYYSSTQWDGYAHYVPSIRGQGLNRLTPEDDFWITIGLKDKEGYYYQGAYCDVVRALDFVCSRPEVDKDKIAVRGGSQGGALSFVAAALDKRVKVCAPNVPFLSDYRDYFKIVDWPRSDLDNYAKTHPDFDWEHVYDLLTYFDIKNLAQWIQCPLLMSIGVQDATCPPHTNFAAYNQVKSEKYWVASPTAGHNISDPQIWENESKFIREKLGVK
ncbi:MAG: acetylxylan esterase [Dysgonamonadaceae bacterium]|jgi:cephalosporin-C deacetylase-like acetyl esterase|nr:acetylxylan esterase [Dysgonamonadaceae bacterium]